MQIDAKTNADNPNIKRYGAKSIDEKEGIQQAKAGIPDNTKGKTKERAVIRIPRSDLAPHCSIRFNHRDESCYGYS